MGDHGPFGKAHTVFNLWRTVNGRRIAGYLTRRILTNSEWTIISTCQPRVSEFTGTHSQQCTHHER